MPRPRLLADVTPLRESREFRLLFGGQLVSFLGSQLTVVAVPVQVYALTRSTLVVGLVSLAQLGPLLVGSLVGGAVADAVDRRRLLRWMQVLLALATVGLAVNASRADPALWPVVVFSALSAGFGGIERPARAAALPRLVRTEQLSSAYALWQVLIQVGGVAGPALAGLLLSSFGAATVYWIDVATFAAAWLAVTRLPPLPPEGGGTRANVASVVEGLRYLKGRPVLQAVFVADINAMVFGMPRAVFPELADRVFGGGAATAGLLFAAPGAGALVGAVTTGWVAGVRRQGRAVLVAVAAWGAAIALFGLVPWLWLALALLAVAGWADVISAVFRNTILQTVVPDSLRGRLSGVHVAVVTGGPRLGDVESGVVTRLAGPQFAVVTGGLACLLGSLAVARWLPAFDRYDAADPVPPPVA